MAGEPKVVKKQSQLYSIWIRLKKNKSAMLGLVIFSIIALFSIFAGVLFDYDMVVIAQNIDNRLLPPGGEHLLGTDSYGRDILARVVYGARISLVIGIATVTVALSIGCLIGALAGFYGGWLDNIIMRIMDVFLSIPSLLLAIAVVASLGPGIFNIMIAVGVAIIPGYSRVMRSTILSIRNREFIEAARAVGTSDARIILRHILPNSIGPVIVQATLGVGDIIITAASLSFLGLGIQPPAPEWGAMLSEGREYIRYLPHLVIFPGLSIMITVLSLNLLGDGLRDALDPRLK